MGCQSGVLGMQEAKRCGRDLILYRAVVLSVCQSHFVEMKQFSASQSNLEHLSSMQRGEPHCKALAFVMFYYRPLHLSSFGLRIPYFFRICWTFAYLHLKYSRAKCTHAPVWQHIDSCSVHHMFTTNNKVRQCIYGMSETDSIGTSKRPKSISMQK